MAEVEQLDVFRQDGSLQNVFTSMGTSKDKTSYTKARLKSFLDRVTIEQLYMTGIPRRFVDEVANTVLKHKTTISLGGDDTNNFDFIEKFEAYLRTIKFHQEFCEAIKLQRLYGGAALVLNVDDGLDDYQQPLNIDRIRQIYSISALSRYELRPYDLSQIQDLSDPPFYQITTSERYKPDQEASDSQLVIHASRVIRLDGLYLPWNLRRDNDGWGMSCIQVLWDAYVRYESAMSGLESMTSDADLFVHKIPGLLNKLAQGGESAIAKRLELNKMSRSVYGGMALDTEEEVNFLTRAISNISSASQPFVQELQAATGWPSSILMGESPGGLGKEGRFEERVWASIVENWQDVYCRDAVENLFTIFMLDKSGPVAGAIPQSWEVKFPSPYTQTDKEKAELQALHAQADSTYINLQVLHPMEVRQSRFGTTEYGKDIQLNDVVTQMFLESASAQHMASMSGYGQQLQAAENPPEPEATEGEQAQASAEEPQAEKTDSVEYQERAGVRIRVTHRRDGINIGYPVMPDGQRMDTVDTLFIYGSSLRGKRLYRSQIQRADGLITPGPFVSGFNTLNQGKKAIKEIFPQYNVVGMTALRNSELETLRIAWGGY